MNTFDYKSDVIILRCFSLILFALVLTVVPQIVFAQTRFLWPDSKVDISHYHHWETCGAVRTRVSDSIAARTKIYADTMHHSLINGATGLPSEVTDAVRQCLERFAPEDVSLQSISFAQSLYLVAGEDAEVQLLLNRKFQSIPASDVASMGEALDNAIQQYTDAKPSRLSAAFELYEKMERLGTSVSAETRIYTTARLANASWDAKDTVRYALAVKKMVDVARLLSQEEWDGLIGEQVSVVIFNQLNRLYRDRFEANLSNSTENFASLQRKLFTELVGRDVRESMWTAINESIGASAKPIYGDFWFPATSAGVSYPRLGKVTFVVMLRADLDWLDALAESVVLRRIKAKNNDLDIVLVAATSGYFKLLEPPLPSREALMVDSLFRVFYKMPGVLAVTNTSFWRLPGFDRRRINDPTLNEENGYGTFGSVLIDKEGKIVANDLVAAITGEERLERLILILQNRPAKTP